MKNLKTYLKDWIDFDGAEFYLGCVLGIFENDDWTTFNENKHIFWTNNSLGNLLFETLEAMADEGILDMDEDSKFRWK